jgi:hypothetical protein
MFIDLLKEVIPVALSFVGATMLTGRVLPMLPGVSSLGTFQGPALSVASVFLAHYGTQKVGFLAKHKGAIMLGTGLAAVRTLFQAFAPASVQSMLTMGDYVQMGDYVAVGGAPPLNENFALSDYVAVGGDGLEEELGIDQDLGVEEALGDARMGGLPGPVNGGLLKPVPTQAFLAPIPARSFTKQIPAATPAYDNANVLYNGIFGGGFGH